MALAVRSGLANVDGHFISSMSSSRLLLVVSAALLVVGGSSVPAQAPSAAAVAAKAKAILEAYRKQDPMPSARKLHIVAWRCHDRDFPADQDARLQRIMEHVRNFYATEMERNGLGRLTFPLDYDPSGKMVIHRVTGAKDFAQCSKAGSGDEIRRECTDALRKDGIDPDKSTYLIFTNLAEWDPQALTFRHRSPYMGGGDFRSGRAWQLDHTGLDVTNLTAKEPMLQDAEYGRISLGRHNSIFLGGITHELGHALSLPHCCGAPEEASLGTALMGSGNRTYFEQVRGEGKGTYLSLASALRLASLPLFTGSEKGLDTKGGANFPKLDFKPAPRSFTITGRVEAPLPVHAVVAYLDPEGHDDYDARTAVCVPESDGSFTLACGGLVAGRSGDLRLTACMANGAVSMIHRPYRVGGDGAPDLSLLLLENDLRAFRAALSQRNLAQARTLAEALPAGSASGKAATALVEAAQGKNVQLEPAAVPAGTKSIPLSRLKPETATVGWGRPSYDILPAPEFLIQCGGQWFATGIYAHAPALHRYDLTKGEGKKLVGKCGLPSNDWNAGSVVFVIRADGKEVFRSPKTEPGLARPFEINLTGVRALELGTEDAGDGGNNDWGLWLDAMVSR